MPKPRDPVINVISYFEHAELPLARQALSMAQAIVKNRTPSLATSVKRAKARPHRRREPELPLSDERATSHG